MSIQQTRKGFSYQDYVAVKVFLERYLDGDLREFYVDYLYDEDNELSHDIYFLTGDDEESKAHCKEVKTGDRFVTERELIGKALCEIYNYLKANESADYEILVSKDLKDSLGTCWTAIQDLRDNLPLARISPRRREQINLIKDLPHLTKITLSDDDIRDFLSRAQIKHVLPELEYSVHHTSGIELQIHALIQRVGVQLLFVDIETPRNGLIQTYHLTNELIYVTSLYAGTGENMIPHYRLAIAKFFSLLNQEVRPDVDRLDENRAAYLRRLQEHEGIAPLAPTETISSTSELGVLS